MVRWLALLFALLFAGRCRAGFSDTKNPISQPGAQFMSQTQQFERQEDADRFHETSCKDTFVFSGCLGATAASLTHTPTACIAYEQGYRITETGSISYNNNATCWVIYNREITGDLVTNVTFSRVSGTHYLVNCTTLTQPTLPADAGWMMEVVTSAGAITTVMDLRDTTLPGGCGGGGFECSDIDSCQVNVCEAVSAQCPIDVCGTVAAECPGAVDCPPPYCNVKCFGATGDGTTDDTAAIQSAMDACAVPGAGGYDSETHEGCRGGGTVFFPRVETSSGCYKVTGTLTGCGVSLLGEGYGASVICPTDFGSCVGDATDPEAKCSPVFDLFTADDSPDADADGLTGVAARDLCIHGPVTSVTPGTRSSSTDGIHYSTRATLANDWTADRLHISGLASGLVENGLLRRGQISRSRFEFNHIHINNNYCESTITDNYFFDASLAAISVDICSNLYVRTADFQCVPYFIYGGGSQTFIEGAVIDAVGTGIGQTVGNGLIFTTDWDDGTNGEVSGLHIRGLGYTVMDPACKIAANPADYMVATGPMYGHNDVNAAGAGTPDFVTDALGPGGVAVWFIKNMQGTLEIKSNKPSLQTMDIDAGSKWHIRICDQEGLCLPADTPTLTNNAVAPSVEGMTFAKVSNSSATGILTLADGRPGQRLTLLFTNGNTSLADSGNFRLTAAFSSTPDDTLTLTTDGTGTWWEVSRAVN